MRRKGLDQVQEQGCAAVCKRKRERLWREGKKSGGWRAWDWEEGGSESCGRGAERREMYGERERVSDRDRDRVRVRQRDRESA